MTLLLRHRQPSKKPVDVHSQKAEVIRKPILPLPGAVLCMTDSTEFYSSCILLSESHKPRENLSTHSAFGCCASCNCSTLLDKHSLLVLLYIRGDKVVLSTDHDFQIKCSIFVFVYAVCMHKRLEILVVRDYGVRTGALHSHPSIASRQGANEVVCSHGISSPCG